MVHDCLGVCRKAKMVGNFNCDTELACYCEEEEHDCGNPAVPVYSASWAGYKNPYAAAGQPLQAHLVISGAAGVLC
jgi:hypothetical protein